MPRSSEYPSAARTGLYSVGCEIAYAEVRMVAGSHGKIFGLLPYDFGPPTLACLRRTLWNRGDERFLVPISFGVGWSVNLRSAPRHPLQALLLAALILWRLRARRDPERGR